MATINVSLPDPMTDWIEAQTRSGRFGSASDYLRALIRQDQDRSRAVNELQDLVTEGLESGVSDRTVGEIVGAARREASGFSRT